ncbi:HNH endonuclease signature motif containing protein, partial [Aspergillus ibericus CBS 121593]
VAIRQCRTRDKMCVITHCPADLTDVIHLYPFSMSVPDAPGASTFWDGLRRFWKKERVDAWHQAIFGDLSGTEKTENLICLDPWAHRLHAKGYFALEPVRTDPEGKWMVLRIWWLKVNASGGAVRLSNIPDLPGDVEPADYGIGMMNFRTQKPIRSGDEITLQTPDPVNLPLPDIRILELQWMMNRVAAMRGGAEPDDLEEDSHSSEG